MAVVACFSPHQSHCVQQLPPQGEAFFVKFLGWRRGGGLLFSQKEDPLRKYMYLFVAQKQAGQGAVGAQDHGVARAGERRLQRIERQHELIEVLLFGGVVGLG